MKEAPYMSREELIDYLKVDVFAAEAEAIADKTPNKDWKRKLKTVSTYCKNIAKERFLSLDVKQMPSVTRRRKHCEIRILSSDECRARDLKDVHKGEMVTVVNDELVSLFQVVDHCCCSRCREGDVVAKCEIRAILHNLGCPVYDDNPAESHCEFHWNSDANDLGLDVDYDKEDKKDE